MLYAIKPYLPLLQFHLLPIRDWNIDVAALVPNGIELQFHLLPIRDWN